MIRALPPPHGLKSSLIVVLAVGLSACASNVTPSASPESAPPSVAAVTVAPSLSEPSSASPVPSTLPSTVATPVASGPVCAAVSQIGLLPSDRLVNVEVSSNATNDLLRFIFATSTPGPGGPAQGTLQPASPPFTFAGSGQSLQLLGQHAVQVRFSGMTIASDTGEAIYQGPTDIKPGLPALREAIQYDASEGIVGWYVGYDGPGCVSVVRDGNAVIVMIAHPETPAG